MKPPEILETERLILRKPREMDAQGIFDTYGQDRQVTRYMTWRPNTNATQTAQFVRESIAGWKEEKRYPWVIVLKEKDELIGMIELRPAGFKAEIGYVMARAHWGHGIMTEAARSIVRWALAQPEIYRVWAVCDVENIASARVLEKVGMMREGILRRYLIHPNLSDEPRDCYCYAVVR